MAPSFEEKGQVQEAAPQEQQEQQIQPIDSLGDMSGSIWVANSKAEFEQNFQEKWPGAEAQLKEMGLTQPELLKEFIFSRHVTQDAGDPSHAIEALDVEIRRELKAMEGRPDHAEIMMGVLMVLESNELVDSGVREALYGEIQAAYDEFETDTISERNLAIRNQVDEKLAELVTDAIKNETLPDLQAAYKVVREASLPCETGAEALTALAVLADGEGLASKVAEAMTSAGLYLVNTDDRPNGAEERVEFINSMLAL